ncbi:MAG: glycosyltransferase family 4 protein, partial [bacterium]
ARRIEEILDLMRKADVFVLPCGREDDEYNEGFSVTAVEAMACGLPVIASKANGIDELVDASTGRIIPAGNHVALAKAIQNLLTNDVLREKLGRTARQKVANKYNLDETIKGKINLLYPGIPTKSDALPIAWYMLEE